MRWKRLVRVLVLTFSAAAVASAAPQQATPSGSDTAKPAGLILGQVIDALRGQPVSGATVTLGVSVTGPVADPFAATATTRRVITDSSGEFLFRDLAGGTYSPGDYYMATLTEFDNADIYDAGFLKTIAKGAIKITLAEGEMKTQDLKLAGG